MKAVVTLMLIFIFILAVESCYALGEISFPYSDDMKVKLVAEEMVVNGLPMKAYQFQTKKSIEDVVKYYAGIWPDLNDVQFGEWRILSHRDKGYLLTVQFESDSNKITHGLLGISPLFDLMDASKSEINKMASGVGKGFLLPPNSEVINDITSIDLGKDSRTIVFRNKLSINRNYQYFRTQYSNKGWVDLITSASAAKKLKTQALAMNKKGQELNVSFSKQGSFTYGVVVHVK